MAALSQDRSCRRFVLTDEWSVEPQVVIAVSPSKRRMASRTVPSALFPKVAGWTLSAITNLARDLDDLKLRQYLMDLREAQDLVESEIASRSKGRRSRAPQ